MKSWLDKYSLPILTVISLTLVFTLYSQILHAEFSFLDDNYNIAQNPYFLTHNLDKIWSRSFFGLYVPMSYTIWYFIWDLFPGGSEPFHLLNMFLHVTNVVLLFSLLRKLRVQNLIAVFCALLFLLHPIQVEAVAWITEGRGLLSTAFGLSALLLWLSERRTIFRDTLALILFCIALLCKPGVALLPCLVLWLRFFENSDRNFKKAFLPLLALAAGVADLILSKYIQAEEMSTAYASPLLLRPLLVLDQIGFSISKIVWPWPLMVDEGRSPQRILENGLWHMTAPIALLCLGALAFLFYRKRNATSMAGLIFTSLVWLPTSGLFVTFFQAYTMTADRYLYLPLAGLLIMLGSFVTKPPRAYLVALGGVLLIGWACLSYQQIGKWESNLSLFSWSVEHNEQSYLAQSNLASALFQNNRCKEAHMHFAEAIKLQPLELSPIAGDMLCFVKEEKIDDIISEGQTALKNAKLMEINARSTSQSAFYAALGYAYARKSDWSLAHQYLCEATVAEVASGVPESSIRGNLLAVEKKLAEQKVAFTSCVK